MGIMAEKNRPAGASDEPSIEEILGSIRRIIAEDDDVAPSEGEEEPLELTNKIDPDGTIMAQQAEEAIPAPVELAVAEEKIVVEEASTPEEKIAFAEEVPPMPSVQEETVTPSTSDAILSETTAQATAAVMAKLARRSAVTEEGGAEGITLEAIVREMLRPMLREWLDTNLPDIVEKVVEREMERLSKRI